MDIKEIESEIIKIKQRNQRVELDKEWEGSYSRRFLIGLFTYVSIGVYMWFIGVDKPLLNAIVPTIGFTLSTLSLPIFKEIWKRYHN
jgi:hypothetical protein